MQEIRLSLSLNEVNEILEALGERPYRSVHRTIEKIHEQASTQIEGDGDAAVAAPAGMSRSGSRSAAE